ncbi:contractile injection system protein, VgrG/Pvc8 family [Sorangium sp. So ce1151]|uniref:contractile injection system protein, VgrG/Pvc8 family n=1 Tax=Sorangium sp. So ce1151 TaxID=3133332 RepID=UPI003F5DC9B2
MAQRPVRLESTALAGVPFAVCKVRRRVDVHGLYRYEVELAIDEPAPLRGGALSRSRATLVFGSDGEETFVHGMVAEDTPFQREDRRGIGLRITLVPRVWEMTRTRARGTFSNCAVPALIAQKLEAAGFKAGEDFLLRLQREHPPRPRLVQHDRSDFDFIQELCKAAGLSLSFAHDDGRDVLVISDSERA